MLFVAETYDDSSDQIIIFLFLLYVTYYILLLQRIIVNCIFPVLRGVYADKNAVDFFDFLIVGVCKFSPILGRNHSAAIVDAAFYKRIAGIEVLLSFYIDNELDQFPRGWCNCMKTDIIGDCFLANTVIFCVQSFYHWGCFQLFVLMYRNF